MKDPKENPLIFELGPDQKVTIYANCDEWYLVDPGKDPGCHDSKRTYLCNKWFHERLKDDPKGIFKFASLFDNECNFEFGRKSIGNYAKEFEKMTEGYGFDTHVMLMEEFVQSATNNPDIHWW